MLKEIIQYLTTDCEKYAKRMGYLKESIAIDQRYERISDSWNPHISNCKSNIANLAKKNNNYNRIAILGSGSLLDIPMNILIDNSKSIDLYDIVHLNKTRRKFKSESSVIFIEQDICSINKKIFETENISIEKLPKPKLAETIAINKYDLIISANILSQLPLLIEKYLRKRSTLTEKQILDYSFQIINSHVNDLKKRSNRFIIITETRRNYFEKNGKLIESEKPLFGVKTPEKYLIDSWQWKLAPFGEFHKNIEIISEVNCYSNIS